MYALPIGLVSAICPAYSLEETLIFFYRTAREFWRRPAGNMSPIRAIPRNNGFFCHSNSPGTDCKFAVEILSREKIPVCNGNRPDLSSTRSGRHCKAYCTVNSYSYESQARCKNTNAYLTATYGKFTISFQTREDFCIKKLKNDSNNICLPSLWDMNQLTASYCETQGYYHFLY